MNVDSGKTYRWCDDGKTLTFGSYPQSRVTAGDVISHLNQLAGALPCEHDSKAWTDYGYYIGGKTQSFMWYKDVEFQGEKYRGVYFDRYRPWAASFDSIEERTRQKVNGFAMGVTYWFAFEPVRWSVVSQKGGSALLIASSILDSQQFFRHQENRVVDGLTTYPNNYAHSDIRKWLNETFFNVAFDEASQKLILSTDVDNSVASTGEDINPHVCQNTKDRVFLLCNRDVADGLYRGWSIRLEPTAYAQCQGVLTNSDSGCGWWWLRSPDSINGESANCIYGGSTIRFGYWGDVDLTSHGVVPALQIKLNCN